MGRLRLTSARVGVPRAAILWAARMVRPTGLTLSMARIYVRMVQIINLKTHLPAGTDPGCDLNMHNSYYHNVDMGEV